ncbi:MAG TPA: hypothetical protein VMM76_01640 [Pirellulaceae bacterium]|nr:hypothetical protein [Pirellulaceae bacterium]
MHEHQQLPSGKQVMKRFDAEGRVASESHAYGMLDIGITMEFSEGVKTGEMYFVNKRLVSRKRYEKARVEYSDMPPPESNLEDIGGELAKAVQSDRRQRSKAAKEHVPDSEAAMRIDSFCQSMLSTGMQADAKAWIEFTKHTLGEYSHTRSRSIIKKLLRRSQGFLLLGVHAEYGIQRVLILADQFGNVLELIVSAGSGSHGQRLPQLAAMKVSGVE